MPQISRDEIAQALGPPDDSFRFCFNEQDHGYLREMALEDKRIFERSAEAAKNSTYVFGTPRPCVHKERKPKAT